MAPQNIPSNLITDETSHFDRLPENEVAYANIDLMSVTEETSQSDRSPENEAALWNM